MSDFNGNGGRSPFDRDLMLAAKFGAMAANAEFWGREIGTGSSDRIRYDFRRAVLSRYYPTTFKLGDYEDVTTGYLRSLRAKLNQAYYAQPDMIADINRKPEVVVVEIDGHAELRVSA